MRALITISIAILSLIGSGCVENRKNVNSQVRTSASGRCLVSLVQLLATPEKFDKKLVFVEGYYQLRPESSGLFLSKADAEHGIANAVWIGTISDSVSSNQIENVNGAYVRVEGTFEFTPLGGGHMGGWPSEINNVTLLVTIPVQRAGSR